MTIATAPQQKLKFVPLEWQIDPWHDTVSIEKFLTGSAGGGKSREAAEEMHAKALKYAGATLIIGRKDRTAANKSIVPFMKHTVQGNTNWGVYKSQLGLFDYHNGSNMWVVGLLGDAQRTSLRSIGKTGAVDFAWFEEASELTEEDRNEILARMRGTVAGWNQIIYTSNPDSPTHWLYKYLIEGQPNSVYYSRESDNPHNPEIYNVILDKLTGLERKRLVEGRWVVAQGAVYNSYSAETHVLRDPLEPQPRGRYIVSIDFGFTNPFVASLWYIDGEGRMYLYKQIYMTRVLVEDHVPAIKKMIAGHPIEAWVCDHDAEGRATLEKHLHIETTAAYKSVIVGLQAVQQRMKVQPDGRPRIMFSPHAVEQIDQTLEEEKRPTSTIEELPGYAYPKKRPGFATNEHPVKVKDHGMDDMRYAVAYIDQIGDNIKPAVVRRSRSIGDYRG